MPNSYISSYDWARSKRRQIDEETLIDLLKVVKYQADRQTALEELGIEDRASPEEALFDYVLDAIGVPAEGDEKHMHGDHERFSRVCKFFREWFEELFYQEFLLNNSEHGWGYIDLLRELRGGVSNEALSSHYR